MGIIGKNEANVFDKESKLMTFAKRARGGVSLVKKRRLNRTFEMLSWKWSRESRGAPPLSTFEWFLSWFKNNESGTTGYARLFSLKEVGVFYLKVRKHKFFARKQCLAQYSSQPMT